MALESFVAGRYSTTYAGTDVGITNEGYLLQQMSSLAEINTSDAYGDSIIDGIYRGGNVYLQFESKAFKAGSIAPFWPWGSLGVMQTRGGGSPTPIGRLASAVAGSTVMTALAGTAYNTAGATAIATLTAPLGILAPNSPGQLLFHTRLRQVPVRLLCLPTESTAGGVTTTYWFALT